MFRSVTTHADVFVTRDDGLVCASSKQNKTTPKQQTNIHAGLSTKEIQRLYAPIVAEAARVLVPGLGVLVALTSQRGPMLLKRALANGR